MDNIQTYIHEVWKNELDILECIDKVCTTHGLRYSLAYGTLIGAVRHGGFIPWDDDIDLIMPREDYDKLLEIWNEAVPEGYILQNYHTDPDFTQNFTKIRKEHTTFVQSEEESKKRYHKGIFVDIFPGDRVAPGKLCGRLQYYACAINLLYSRGFCSGTGGVIGKIEKLMLRLPKKVQYQLRDKTERFYKQWNRIAETDYIFPSTIKESRLHYPADTFVKLRRIPFENAEYSCVNDYDKILTIQYGDYMQLPPESERVWKHHPIIIDFEHNYEELKNTK